MRPGTPCATSSLVSRQHPRRPLSLASCRRERPFGTPGAEGPLVLRWDRHADALSCAPTAGKMTCAGLAGQPFGTEEAQLADRRPRRPTSERARGLPCPSWQGMGDRCRAWAQVSAGAACHAIVAEPPRRPELKPRGWPPADDSAPPRAARHADGTRRARSARRSPLPRNSTARRRTALACTARPPGRTATPPGPHTRHHAPAAPGGSERHALNRLPQGAAETHGFP